MAGGIGSWVTAAGALAVVLGLLWAAAQTARRGGFTLSGVRAGEARRLRMVEAAAIDARRRAVILRVDGREALVITGGPQDLFLGWL